MLKLFRANSPFSVIALFLATICFKLGWLVHPQPPLVSGDQIAWSQILEWIKQLLGLSPFGFTFLAVINTAAQALYLNRMMNTHHLFPANTYLPALVFILISSLLPNWNYLSAPLIANWFILAAFNGILQLNVTMETRKAVFNMGFFISCAAILVFPYLFFALLLFIALGIIRSFKTGEWAMVLFGLFTPLYLLAGVLYLTDSLAVIPRMTSLAYSLPAWPANPMPFITASITLFILLMAGFLYLNIYSERMLTQVKKSWGIVIAGLFISVIPGMIYPLYGFSMWFPTVLFLSLIAANIWIEEKRSWLIRILFYLLVAVVIFAVWYVKQDFGN